MVMYQIHFRTDFGLSTPVGNVGGHARDSDMSILIQFCCESVGTRIIYFDLNEQFVFYFIFKYEKCLY